MSDLSKKELKSKISKILKNCEGVYEKIFLNIYRVLTPKYVRSELEKMLSLKEGALSDKRDMIHGLITVYIAIINFRRKLKRSIVAGVLELREKEKRL